MARLTMGWVIGLLALAGGSSVLGPVVSAAALGDREPPGSFDAQSEATTAGIGFHPGYSVKKIVSNSTQVREFLRSDGTVFGLAWKGRNHPDFQALLGSYYTEYQELSTQRTTGVRRMRGGRRSMKGAHLVIEKFGHMGAIRGRAYIASLFPTGVTANEIK